MPLVPLPGAVGPARSLLIVVNQCKQLLDAFPFASRGFPLRPVRVSTANQCVPLVPLPGAVGPTQLIVANQFKSLINVFPLLHVASIRELVKAFIS